ncbi:hypothetical protein [Aquibium oceanicum]|uniref:Uncharacterized protein n=1 Tax=Aquibium oceanicum TaxID=1670800 RepID=A0A1L3SU84_9HYPH|nr:hypothetical protein [Aquibium oceanicum]APH72966.1 hypothetical protein BSQ44_17540 [Aquibium oceanicum]
MLMRARRNAKKTLLELRNASARPSVLDQGVDDGIVVSRENWVHMWLDMRHVVHASGGMISAFRGVSFEGQPMWMVRHIDKALGYHSLAPDAGSAIIEAEAAWEERKRVRRRWREVESLARDLLLGRVSLRITIEMPTNPRSARRASGRSCPASAWVASAAFLAAPSRCS